MYHLVIFSAIVASAYSATVGVGDARSAQILRLESDIDPEGNFHYAYDTENGISANEEGTYKQVGEAGAVVAQGGFSFQSPEGEAVQVQYVADENGYQPVGSHLPTAPPIPPAIQRSLDFIAAHPLQLCLRPGLKSTPDHSPSGGNKTLLSKQLSIPV